MRAWRNKPKQQWRAKAERKEAAPEQRTPTDSEAGPSKGKVSMVCVNDQTALHSPVWINGVKFTRCLIDSGSEVNLISVKDAIKHGFGYELGGIKTISGLNGSSSPVDGLMDCDIRLGPSGGTKEVDFLVAPNVTIPILGCPALTKLCLVMDWKEKILTDDQGNVVRCSAVHNRKF